MPRASGRWRPAQPALQMLRGQVDGRGTSLSPAAMRPCTRPAVNREEPLALPDGRACSLTATAGAVVSPLLSTEGRVPNGKEREQGLWGLRPSRPFGQPAAQLRPQRDFLTPRRNETKPVCQGLDVTVTLSSCWVCMFFHADSVSGGSKRPDKSNRVVPLGAFVDRHQED